MSESSPSASADFPVLRIEPAKGWVSLRLGELWLYRELLYFLTWRDVKVRYKQTALGASWAIIQPLLTMVVFSLFFGKLANVPSDGLPYPIFSFAALVPWTFFANGLTQSSNSLVGSANLIKKVYFPRLAIPIATILSGVVDFFLAFLVLLGMMAFYGIMPTVHTVWLPLFLLLAVITSLGAGLWLTALNVHYRDIKYIVPFLAQIWMFATPIVYSSSILDKYPGWQTAYGINPMVGVVEGFRWALLGGGAAALNEPELHGVQTEVAKVVTTLESGPGTTEQRKELATVVLNQAALLKPGVAKQDLLKAGEELAQNQPVLAARTLYEVQKGLEKRLKQSLRGPGPMIAVSALASILLLVSGAFYFRRMEKSFADVV